MFFGSLQFEGSAFFELVGPQTVVFINESCRYKQQLFLKIHAWQFHLCYTCILILRNHLTKIENLSTINDMNLDQTSIF